MNAAEEARALDAVYAAAHWLYSNGREREALDVFRTILLVAPTDERGWIGLAETHAALGEDDRTLRLYQLAMETTANRARVALGLARTVRRLGEDATDAYDGAEAIADAENCDELVLQIKREKVLAS